MLPDGNGTDFCAEIRAVSDAHVLFLTSRREHEEKLRSLRAGGDDYITKPFKMDELLERVASSIRRRGMSKARAQSITKGSLTLDVIARRAYLSGEDLCLTPMEYGVLLLLAQNEGQAMSAEAVYEKVWGVPPVRGDRNTVKKTVSCVRGKIDSQYLWEGSVRSEADFDVAPQTNCSCFCNLSDFSRKKCYPENILQGPRARAFCLSFF